MTEEEINNKIEARFLDIIKKFPDKLEELKRSEPFTNRELKRAPEKGIYVFFDENDLPIYVGRSDRMRARLREHCQQSSTHTSATFAFNLAKDLANDKKINTNMARKDLESIPEFKELYRRTKERVSKMKIRAIEIRDPIEQTLFEVYVHLGLKTKNDFKNH